MLLQPISILENFQSAKTPHDETARISRAGYTEMGTSGSNREVPRIIPSIDSNTYAVLGAFLIDQDTIPSFFPYHGY
jgi:hypothetical protein